MKRLLLLLPVCFILQGNAQTVITTAVKPAVGDSFNYAFYTITTGISITAPGGNQNWDLSFLNSPLQRTEVYRPKDQGANGNSFPTADAVVTQGLTEYYYKFNANNIQLLGTGTR
ncbi:MAG TPA: hypothetical protein VFX48_02725, partial [Saprospiraceae bacterium]|nr:hypothetical protein [Saprospiraceae bacterium]